MEHGIGRVSMEDVLRFQCERNVKNLFKSFLLTLEDLATEHDAAMGKLYEALPEHEKVYVKLADYLDEDKAEHLRSRVLRAGNDCLRELNAQLDNYEITLKQKDKGQ